MKLGARCSEPVKRFGGAPQRQLQRIQDRGCSRTAADHKTVAGERFVGHNVNLARATRFSGQRRGPTNPLLGLGSLQVGCTQASTIKYPAFSEPEDDLQIVGHMEGRGTFASAGVQHSTGSP